MDHREYRQSKQWVASGSVELSKEARGSFVWTPLQGRALEIVEHLSEDQYQKEGGDKI